MLGRGLAPLDPAPRRWLHRAWGYPDVHTRQHWHALWPHLAALPSAGLAVVDAGCGAGRWTLELAVRRPGWRLWGVDRDPEAIAQAERARRRLNLSNVSFVQTDMRTFVPPEPCDVVLSVASAHYLAEAGEGEALFACYASWLACGGRLMLLGPRGADMPFVPWLAHPAWHPVFTAGQLERLCTDARLEVEQLAGRVGICGVLAKQLAWSAGARGRAAVALTYPLQCAMVGLDRLTPARRPLMWLLIARRGTA